MRHLTSKRSTFALGHRIYSLLLTFLLASCIHLQVQSFSSIAIPQSFHRRIIANSHLKRRQGDTNLCSTPNNEDVRPDDPNYLYYRPQSRAAPQGGKWAYTEPNIRRAAQTFLDIRAIGGVESTNDLYARSPGRFEYWYVGKLARTDGTVSLELAVATVWNMVEEHACRLRPVELGREFGNIELWVAKGDSELEMSQAVAGDSGFGLMGLKKMEEMNLKKMEKAVEMGGRQDVKTLEVGFMAEVVTNTGKGFYIVRDDLGKVMQ